MTRSPRPPTDDDQKTEFFDRGAPRPNQVEMATPTVVDPVVERSAPNPALRVISMKTPADLAGAKKEAKQHQVQIRSVSNVVRPHDTPTAQRLGRLAPPRDPREARARRLRDYAVWGCVVVILASIVMLAVWFIARR